MEDHIADKAWVVQFEKPKGNPAALEPATTVLSPYLKFGCLSVRLFYKRLEQVHSHKTLTAGLVDGDLCPDATGKNPNPQHDGMQHIHGPHHNTFFCCCGADRVQCAKTCLAGQSMQSELVCKQGSMSCMHTQSCQQLQARCMKASSNQSLSFCRLRLKRSSSASPPCLCGASCCGGSSSTLSAPTLRTLTRWRATPFASRFPGRRTLPRLLLGRQAKQVSHGKHNALMLRLLALLECKFAAQTMFRQ